MGVLNFILGPGLCFFWLIFLWLILVPQGKLRDNTSDFCYCFYTWDAQLIRGVFHLDVPFSCWFFKIFQLDLRMCTSVYYSYHRSRYGFFFRLHSCKPHTASHPLALIWAVSGLSPMKVLHTFI